MTTDAAVYRCETGGKVQFTDRPCTAGAQPHPLTPATVISPGEDVDLVRAYDERLERERGERDAADGAFLKRHKAEKAEAARIRKAVIGNRIVPGMRPEHVRRVLGPPDEVSKGVSGGSATERWTYREGKSRRQVVFRDGAVSQAGETAAKKKK